MMRPPHGQPPDDQKNQRYEDGVEHDRPADAGVASDAGSMDGLGAVEGQGTAGADQEKDLDGGDKKP
jgi:hypothetical protein